MDYKSPLIDDSNESLVTSDAPPRYSSIFENTYSYVQKNKQFIYTVLTIVIVIVMIYYLGDFGTINSEPTLNDRISRLNEMQNKNIYYLCSQ